MKKILTVIIINIFIFTGIYSFAFCENLYPINDKKGGGYINKDGVIVLKQQYKFAGKFVDNYAIVQNKKLKEGIIDKKGNVIIDFKYDCLQNLSENFVIYKENKKYGFINIVKKEKSKAIFDNIKIFKEGLAAACIDGQWGFINQKGKFVIEPKYYDVSNFSQGLAAVSYSKHNTASYIDKKGKIIISFTDNNLEPKEFKEGLVPVIKGNDEACSYINNKGKVVIDKEKIFPINAYCGNFHEGLTVIYIYNKPNEVTTGFMDKKGNIKYALSFLLPKNMLKEEFSVFGDFSSNMASFTIDYKTGYINNKFELVIPPIYEFARDFEDDLAYVKYEDIEGYINKKGKWVWYKEREGT